MAKNTTTRDAFTGALRLMKAFRPEIAEEKSLLVSSTAALLFSVVFRILEPWPLKFIYDLLFHTKSHAQKLVFFSHVRPEVLLGLSAASLVAVTALAGTADTVTSRMRSMS